MWTRASASIYPCSNWVAVTSDPQHLRTEGGAAGRLCVHLIHRGHPPALRAAARPGRLLGMAVSLFSEGWKTFAAMGPSDHCSLLPPLIVIWTFLDLCLSHSGRFVVNEGTFPALCLCPCLLSLHRGSMWKTGEQPTLREGVS